jgi:homoserine kinase
MSFVRGPVTLTVPATSANLGPGFDSLGLALELRDELTATVTRAGLHVEVSGEGADEVPRGEDHLVVRAMRAAFAELGGSPAGLELTCTNVIPHARGLGSSAAAIVAGVHLARALVEDGRTRLGDHAAFQLAASIEGHLDNVAAASFGGLTIAWTDDGLSFAAPTQVSPAVRAVAFIPPTGLSTEVARGLLPETVAHADAAASAGRAALLVAAMATGWAAKLLPATRDRLHQEYRRPAMPDSLALVDALRDAGHAAVVSGAGPTVLVLTSGHADLASYTPDGWAHRPLEVAAIGVRVT